MSSYPVLKNRPIDQWKVTELKDELRRRQLPVKGLKDDLVRRLAEALRIEMAEEEEKVDDDEEEKVDDEEEEKADDEDEKVGEENNLKEEDEEKLNEKEKLNEEDPPIEDVKVDKAPVIADAEVSQAPMVADAEVSQAPVVADAEVSQAHVAADAEVSQAHVAADAEVSQAHVAVDAEVSQAPVAADAEVSQSHTVVAGAEVSQSHTVVAGAEVSQSHTVVAGAEVSQSHTVVAGAEVSQSHTVVADAEVSQSHTVVADAEVSLSQAHTVVDVAEFSEAPASETALTKGEEPESIPRENAELMEVHLQDEGHSNPVVEKTTEVDTNEKMVVGDIPLDATTTDLPAADVKSEIPAADVKSEVPAADVKSDGPATDVKSDVTEDSKIQEVETVPSPMDAVASDAVAMDTDAAATALGNNDTENLVEKNDSGDNAMMDDEESKDTNLTDMYDQERKDSKLTDEDSKPTPSEPNDQVPVVSPDLGSHIKCESISTDTVSINEKNNLKDNLNADNFDLELEVKPEMVQPSSSILSIGGDLQPLDDDKELVKNQASLEEIDYTTNMESAKKDDSPEGGSAEKLNLDRSSGDESMEEDVMESKQVESNIRSDDLGGKTEVTSEHVVKEVTLPHAVVEGLTVDTKQVVAEEKPEAPTEKRKFEAQEVSNNEPVKRQRRWNADNVKAPERQNVVSGSDAPKDVFQPALKRSFGRSDSTASGDSPKERIVPPPQKPATTSLRIDRFVRPFTLKAVQELLAKTGSVCSFWMDHIKTHCYVTYSSVDEAVATRNAIYNLQWPPNNGNHLVAEFVDPQDVKLKLEAPPPPPVPISPSTATTPKAAPFQQAQANQTLPRQSTTPREQLPPPPPLAKPPTSDPASARERLPPTPKKQEPPVVTLDDLFKKTKASPRIYYLPLSEEEAAAKLEAQGKGRRE